jgi:hypothetical protein
MASLYSMKPKPFISLISVISPVPWVLKWFSTSALVATVHAVQSANAVELSESPQAQAPAPTAVDQGQGIACITMQGCATGQSATETRRRCSAEAGKRNREPWPATSTSALPRRACSARVSCRAHGSRGRERERWNAISGSSKKRTIAREVAKVEALYKEYVRSPGQVEQRVVRAGRGARRGMGLTVSGAFPSGSMVTAACPVTGSFRRGSVLSFLVCVQAISALRGGWVCVNG